MAGTIRELMNDSLAASFDPSGQYRAAMRTLTAVMKGEIDEISPANPVVYTIENQAALIAAFTENMQSETSRLLQVHAQEPEDLYPQMAQVHFTNIFNLPSSTVMTMVLEKREILNAMVKIPGSLSKKLTIPRNTYFTIADYTFGIHYPIDIIEPVHGGLRVSYDTGRTTSLQSLSTNMLKWRMLTRDSIEYVAIDIPVHQFSIVSKTPTVTLGTSFSHNVEFNGLYYACRIYRTLEDGTQKEISVSYSDESYDPLSPTAVVKVLDGRVNISIPQIYINQQQISGELRIDVYTTSGPLETSFDAYPIGSIGYWFRDLEKKASSTYSAPLKTLSTCIILADRPVSGGALGMSFEDLRAAVIADSLGDPSLPVTPAQIQNHLKRRGYDIIKHVDLVTDRVFLATKDMPEPQNLSLLTAANGSIETMNAALIDLTRNGAVIDNDLSVTLTPDAIYRLEAGILRLVSDNELKTIRQMRRDLLAEFVTEGNFLYSPYHYVLDKTNNQFRSAAYYLDDPSVTSQTFIADNEGSLMQVNTAGYELIKKPRGYTLRVVTSSNDVFKELDGNQIHVVLGFRSPTEDDLAWVSGVLIGTDPKTKERVYEFDLQSRFFMNASDRIDFRNFKMYDVTDKTIYAALDQDFTIVYGTTAQMGPLFKPGMIDAKLPRYLVPYTCSGITEERLTLHFGDALSNLWARARTVATTVEYELNEIDIFARYTTDVYKKDPVTGSELFMVNGKPERILLHKRGDNVKDSDGQDVLLYPKGSVKYDPITGLPVVKDTRKLKHRFELFLIEGVYAFSNDDIAINYRNAVARTVANWVVSDLKSIQDTTMDNTKVYFYPKTVFGTIDVRVIDGVVHQVDAAQRFEVSLYVPLSVARDDVLKDQLKRITVSVISDYLKNRTLATSDIIELLREAYGEDAIDVQVSNFGKDFHIPVMQLVNEVHRCGIRKRLVARDDELLVVEEDVSVTFSTIE